MKKEKQRMKTVKC